MTFLPLTTDAIALLLGAFGAAAILALVLTPAVKGIAGRLDVIDEPEERRVNTRPIVRGGGVGVAIAFVAVSLVVLAINSQTNSLPVPFSLNPPTVIALFAGGVAAAMMGAIDDYLQLRARWQLAGQLLVAVWAVTLGVTIRQLNSPFGDGVLQLVDPIAIGFTIFWIVGMMNAINFIDGLDGLSSGIGLIAALTLGIFSLTVTASQPLVAVICVALAGALLGFLRWNFHPATIFAGTSGTMFLGYTVALLAIVGVAKVSIALLVLAVPIIDTFWIIVRRLVTGRTPFSPDRGHIHHRLLDLGLTHRQTVLLIYLVCAVLALLGLLLRGQAQVFAFVAVFVVSGLVVYWLGRDRITANGHRPAEGPKGAGGSARARRNGTSQSRANRGTAVGPGRSGQANGRPATGPVGMPATVPAAATSVPPPHVPANRPAPAFAHERPVEDPAEVPGA